MRHKKPSCRREKTLPSGEIVACGSKENVSGFRYPGRKTEEPLCAPCQKEVLEALAYWGDPKIQGAW